MQVNYNGSLNDAALLPYVITKAKESGICIDKLFAMDIGFFDKTRADFLQCARIHVLIGASLCKYKTIAEYIFALVKQEGHTDYTYLLSSVP